MNLENLYNEIISHRSLWEDVLDEHHIKINYEDILKMKHKRIEIYDIYSYQNMVFEQSKIENGKYFFHVLKDVPEGGIQFFVTLRYIDCNFRIQDYTIRFLKYTE